MKRLRTVFCFLEAVILSISILCGFVMVWDYPGIHYENTMGFTDFFYVSGQYIGTASEGFYYGRLDENGFNNAPQYVFDDHMEVLIVGDSDMAAEHIPTRDSISYLLNEKGITSYSIGLPEHEFATCLQNVQAADSRFHPENLVLFSSTMLTSEAISQVSEHSYPEIRSYDKGLMYYLQKIPVLRSAYRALEQWALRKSGPDAVHLQKETEPAPVYSEEDAEHLEQMLRNIKNSIDSNLIILYSPPVKLSKTGLELNHSEQQLDVLHEVCEKLQIPLLDASETYKNAFLQDYVVPYGFCNSLMGEGHLNKNGHAMLADLVADYLQLHAGGENDLVR